MSTHAVNVRDVEAERARADGMVRCADCRFSEPARRTVRFVGFLNGADETAESPAINGPGDYEREVRGRRCSKEPGRPWLEQDKWRRCALFKPKGRT